MSARAIRVQRRILVTRNLNLYMRVLFSVPAAVLLAQCAALAAAPAPCSRIVLSGEAVASQEWRQPLGQGWVFRLVPVAPGPSAFTGWDLVVDRDPPAGYPDALLLATPPYHSIGEREIATTFGLRAQDALGWNPRSFRFLTDPASFLEARKQFQILGRGSVETPVPSAAQSTALQRLLTLSQHASAGQFRILDARIAPGTADAAPFAQRWALQSSRTPYTIGPNRSSPPTAHGELNWIRFSITLWLPAQWKAPAGIQTQRVPCSE
jgi:hypothetical protein